MKKSDPVHPPAPKLRKSNRSLIPSHRLVIDQAWVEMGDLLVKVHDKRTGRQELLCVAPARPICYVPGIPGIRNLINRFIKYDLLSEEQFICLNEVGKQNYIQIMRQGFYPRLCTVWMRFILDFIDGKKDSFITKFKTLKAWAEKEKAQKSA